MVGTLATKLTPPPSWIPTLTSIAILGLGAFLVLREFSWKSGLVLASVGLASELCGVSTGVPFGEYRYTDIWKPVVQLPNNQYFPLLLPLAWCLVAGGAYVIVPPNRFRPLFAAIIAAAVDLGMEFPMTQKLHYWHWVGSTTPPVSNTLGWIATAALGLFACGQGLEPKHPQSKFILPIFAIFITFQWVFA